MREHEIGKLDEGSGQLPRAICSLSYFVARIDHICHVCLGGGRVGGGVGGGRGATCMDAVLFNNSDFWAVTGWFLSPLTGTDECYDRDVLYGYETLFLVVL